MRGEKNIDRIAIMTPSTPGSVSTYQRMHSNESDYSIGAGAGTATGVGSGTISGAGSGPIASCGGLNNTIGGGVSGINGNGSGALSNI